MAVRAEYRVTLAWPNGAGTTTVDLPALDETDAREKAVAELPGYVAVQASLLGDLPEGHPEKYA